MWRNNISIFISQIPHSLYNLLRTDAFMKMHWMIFIFLLQERIHLVCISIMQFLCQCYRAISLILFKKLSWYKHMVMESKRYLLVEKSISITHYMLGAYIFQFFMWNRVMRSHINHKFLFHTFVVYRLRLLVCKLFCCLWKHF